ncbi:MAG: response regulator [Ruminococcus sp.]|nr:response regulator [Ruminococcus sp.]
MEVLSEFETENRELEIENQKLTDINKQLNAQLRTINREFNAQKRQLRVMEMSFKSRNVMYRSQIETNERQRRFLTSFMYSSQNFMIFLDEKLSVAFISKKLLSYVGLEYDDAIIGTGVSEFYERYFDEHHAETILSAINTVSETMQPVDNRLELIENNTERFYLATCSPMSDDENNLCGIIIIYYDETDILTSMKQAVEANNAKSRFLATMSHEIRTPLNAIIGISDIEITKAASNPKFSVSERKTTSSFEIISRSAQSLLSIINDILDLSKAETGKLEILTGTFDFASLLNDTIQLNITRIGVNPVVFNLCLEGDIPDTVIGDELRIKQILNNVLSNAFKYTEFGSVKLHVKSDIDGENANITFKIIDTGQGMREEDLRMVFDEYSRFNQFANRKKEGTGLGLNITGHLVSLMNGNISAESKFGKGSVFTITLPLKIPPDAKFIPEKVKKELEKFKYDTKIAEQGLLAYEYMPYGKVLVVDDVETNLFVMEGLLAPYGIKCERAISGKKAIEAVQDGDVYDVIFMDHMMPEMDGIEATKLIRSLGYNGIIVALTANAIAGNDVMFKANGFDDFVSKPIDIRLLDKCIQKYVKNIDYKTDITDVSVMDSKLKKIFLRDAKNAKKSMSEQIDKGDLKGFAITVHGMKSACANVGEEECSVLAKELEFAAKDGNFELVAEKYLKFDELLTEVMVKFRVDDTVATGTVDLGMIREQISAICDACEEYDSDSAMEILSGIRQEELTEELRELFSGIEDDVFHSDFEEAVKKCHAHALPDSPTQTTTHAHEFTDHATRTTKNEK